MKLLAIFILCLALGGCVPTTYRHDGITFTRTHLFSDSKTFAVVRLPDGAIIVAGATDSPNAAAIGVAAWSLLSLAKLAAPLLMGLPSPAPPRSMIPEGFRVHIQFS